jgi:hypothetical protein
MNYDLLASALLRYSLVFNAKGGYCRLNLSNLGVNPAGDLGRPVISRIES